MEGEGSILEVTGLEKSYGRNKVLKGVDLTVRKGEVIAIIGPSGCGKSTFIRCLNLLEEPDCGKIVYKGTDLVSPAVYTKRNDRVSMINRNAEYTAFNHIELSDNTYSGEYTFIRICKVKDRKTGEQVLFAAVPNRETNILAYSDSAHKADKTVTFGKFRIFCFVETDNNLYTDLIVDSEKIHLEKSKRKGMYFIGLNEVKKKK